jgi:tRNA modification GTPase
LIININKIYNDETIIALATPQGLGAVAIIRVSGKHALNIVNKQFKSKFKEKNLLDLPSHSIHLGHIIDGNRIIDEVLVSIFRSPNSYTGEDIIEINCHGSIYIQQEIIKLFLKKGVRQAKGGEFTLRAFLNGKMDLSQAEAVADVIVANSAASHQIAIQQMRGGFSKDLYVLRQQLLNFASLIELELDFSEEDLEFANRNELNGLIKDLLTNIKFLLDSFSLGNVFKNGIPVAIVGEPNVGKSTLLNALLNEDKAIVSEIAGTTRDAIEDEISIHGVVYRFIDTAGIRETKDYIENIGIKKTFENIKKAQLVLFLVDAKEVNTPSFKIFNLLNEISKLQKKYPDKKILSVINKTDLLSDKQIKSIKNEDSSLILLSAKNKTGIHQLTEKLTDLVAVGTLSNNQTIVSNARHFEALTRSHTALLEVQSGIENNISSDLLAIDIHESLRQLGSITGEFEIDKDLLGNIFQNFCVGK